MAEHWDGHLAADHPGHVDGSFCGQGLLVADDYACAPLHATREPYALRFAAGRAFQRTCSSNSWWVYATRMYIGYRGARRDIRVGLVEGVSIVLGEGVGPPLSTNGTRITTMLTTKRVLGRPCQRMAHALLQCRHAFLASCMLWP